MVKVSGNFFCSNPGALGIDESEKGIFDSLKNIAQLAPGPPKEDDRLGDSAAGTSGTWPSGRRARSLLPLALVSGFMRCDRVVFCHSFADILVFFR